MNLLINGILSPICGAIMFLIFAYVIASWLIVANIINLRNPNMRMIYNTLETFANTILAPIRRFIPSIGGLDFSPIIALIGLNILPDLIRAVFRI